MGRVSQPLFTNGVVEIRTRLSPRALLAELQAIERRNGRVRTLRWGPRTLDLDLLVYGDTSMREEDLVIPHPGIPHRSFVIQPLFEIAPNLSIPGMQPPALLIKRCGQEAPRRLASRGVSGTGPGVRHPGARPARKPGYISSGIPKLSS